MEYIYCADNYNNLECNLCPKTEGSRPFMPNSLIPISSPSTRLHQLVSMDRLQSQASQARAPDAESWTVLLPPELDGSRGLYRRANDENGSGADSDLDAIRVWLARCRSPATHRSYRKEAERFLLWALIECGKPLSSLNVADCQAFERFLRQVGSPEFGPRNQDWVGPVAPRSGDEWRPFQGPLARRSVNQALVICSSLMQWLKEVGYLRHNPFANMAIRQSERITIKADERFLNQEQVDYLLVFAAQLDDYVADSRNQAILYSLEPLEGESHVYRLPKRRAVWVNLQERLLCFLILYFQTGARISELVEARMGDLFLAQTGNESGWWLRLIGKGRKVRDVPLPNAIAAITRYRQYRGLPPYPGEGETAPLIAGAGSEKPIGAHALHNELKRFMWLVCRELALRGTPVQQSTWVPRLRKVTMHWARHSFASRLVNNDVPLPMVADLLGHSSIAITKIYTHFEKQDLFRQVKAST